MSGMPNPADASTPFDDFLDRLFRGESVDPAELLSSHAGLSPEEREQISRICSHRDGEEQAAANEGSADAVPPIARIGSLRLGRRIGSGGMGAVFLAEDPVLGRQVAVKVLGPDLVGTGERAERFQREARAVARLRHPNIVGVHASGEQDGLRYIAMEYVAGASLHDLMSESAAKGTRLALDEVLKWGAEIARALHAAHGAEIVHRDVKPSNIRIAEDGRAVLLDFGLAHDAAALTLTDSGVFRGSPQYASPEQVRLSRRGIDARSDVYSLGATLYEASTGVAPFRGETREQLFHQILSTDPVPPRRLDPTLPRDLETVLLAALEKDPERRHRTAAALADDLEAVREGRPVSVRAPSIAGRAGRWARRNPAKAALALALILGIPLVAGLGGFILANLDKIERVRAQDAARDLEAALEQAFLEYGEGDGGGALVLFEEALRLEPRSREAMAGIALARIDGRDPEGALAFLNEPGRAEIQTPWAQRLRVEALKDLGRAEAAEELAKTIGAPSEAIDHFVLGLIILERFHSGHTQHAAKAFEHLRQAVLRAPSPSRLYHYELGHAAWHAGKHREAREIAAAIEHLFPETPERLMAVARTLREADRDAAFDALEKAARNPPRALHARNFIALHLAMSGRGPDTLALAAALARDTVAKDPTRARSQMGLATVLFNQRQLDESIAGYREAIRLDPGLSDAHHLLAKALIYKKDWEGAAAAAREATRLAPREARAWNALGAAQTAMGQLEEGIESFTRAIEIDPEDPSVHCNLGVALLEKGDFRGARDRIREGNRIGAQDKRWKPFAKQAAEAERLASLEDRLDAAAAGRGDPLSPEDLLAIAREVCRPKKRFAQAADFYGRAFEVDATLASHQHLRDAAAAAVTAGFGGGADAPAGAEERRALRERARGWFEQDLRSRNDVVGENEARLALASLASWTSDPRLAAVRGGAHDGFPAEEAEAWRVLWERCRAPESR